MLQPKIHRIAVFIIATLYNVTDGLSSFVLLYGTRPHGTVRVRYGHYILNTVGPATMWFVRLCQSSIQRPLSGCEDIETVFMLLL
jgi:hypothetical protein